MNAGNLCERSIEYQKNKFIIVDVYRNDDEKCLYGIWLQNNYACWWLVKVSWRK